MSGMNATGCRDCPKCGSRPIIIRTYYSDMPGSTVEIWCRQCGLRTLESDTLPRAREYWNEGIGAHNEYVTSVPFREESE